MRYPMKKVIFLVDMNAFFISCEMTRNDSLVGMPAAVAGDPKKRTGIILAANYEARACGVSGLLRNYRFIDYATQGYVLAVGLLVLLFHDGTIASRLPIVAGHGLCIAAIHLLIRAQAARDATTGSEEVPRGPVGSPRHPLNDRDP